MKLGIFGGTFNPIHLGHLISAQCILEQFGLDRILFIPVKYPVHKKLEAPVSAEMRYEMTALAVDDNPDFDCSRMEIDRDEPSYTIITLKRLREMYENAGLYLIVGADSFNEIPTWRDYRDILETAAIVRIPRPGSGRERIPDEKNMKVSHARNPMIEISSSDIRERVRKGMSIRYLVPRPVEEYIIKRELYRQ